jgi:phosphatidate cytidylyltransferase
MIRTRVIVGSLLALAASGVLIGDGYLAPWFPWFPCLFGCLLVLGVLAGRELVQLFPPIFRPPEGLVLAGLFLTHVANWYDVIRGQLVSNLPAAGSAWTPVLFAFTAVLLAAFLVETYRYREPGAAVPRLALAVFAVAYLGLLGSFFARLRWLDHGDLILTLTIFVPKCGDIGAFFTGTFLGRHRMTPILSPKKTWEGFAGGLVASVLTAVGLSFAGPVFANGIVEAVAFGLVVGLAGVLGDLAESLIKRDGQTKDAAKSIPGFGGVLDVIDSVLFAAPVAYVWFRI